MSVYTTSSDVSDYKPEDPAVDSEECCARGPEARDECRLPEKFEPKALVQPQALSHYPKCKSCGPQRRSEEEH